MFTRLKQWLKFHSRPAGGLSASSTLPPRGDDLGAPLREAHHTSSAGSAVEWNNWEQQHRTYGEARGLGRAEIQALGEDLYFHNPHAHGFINLMALFMTDGLRFEARDVAEEGPEGRDREAVQAFNHHFQRWSDRAGFPELLHEIAVRLLSTGECFVCNRHAQEPWRDPALRLIRNYDVATPMGKMAGLASAIADGIETTPGDVADVVAYHVVADRLGLKTERITADAILHLSLNRWQDQTRGLPVHLPMLDLLRFQQSYLASLVRTAEARSKVAIIRRIEGGPSEVEAAAQQARLAKQAYMTSGSPVNGGTAGMAADRERLGRSRIVTVNGGVDYEFKSFNLDAEDAAKVNRLLTLPGAAALCLAEYLYSGDASTNTYASAAAAERAAFKSLKARSRVFARRLLRVVEWVHTALELQGLIPTGGLAAGRYELAYVLPEFPAAAAEAGGTGPGV